MRTGVVIELVCRQQSVVDSPRVESQKLVRYQNSTGGCGIDYLRKQDECSKTSPRDKATGSAETLARGKVSIAFIAFFVLFDRRRYPRVGRPLFHRHALTFRSYRFQSSEVACVVEINVEELFESVNTLRP